MVRISSGTYSPKAPTRLNLMKTSLNEERPDYLLTSQVMARLNMSRNKVRRLIEIGKLTAIREGKFWLITEDSVRVYGRRSK